MYYVMNCKKQNTFEHPTVTRPIMRFPCHIQNPKFHYCIHKRPTWTYTEPDKSTHVLMPYLRMCALLSSGPEKIYRKFQCGLLAFQLRTESGTFQIKFRCIITAIICWANDSFIIGCLMMLVGFHVF